MQSSDLHIGREYLVSDMRRAFVLGAFGLAMIALTVTGFGFLDRVALQRVYESRELMRLARQARLLAVDRESAARGYLLTGNDASLQPEKAAKAALPFKLDSLVRQTAGNPARKDRAEAISRSIGQWERGYLNPALAEAADERVASRHNLAGKELFDAVRNAFTSFISAEERLYERRVAFEGLLVRISLGVILLEILFVVIMMRRLNGRVIAQAEQVLEQQHQLEEQAAELEQQAAELEEQAMQLEEQTDESRLAAEAMTKLNGELMVTVAELGRSRDETSRISDERQQAQSLLDFVLDSSPVGFGLFDRSLRFTLANEAMGQLNHMPAADLIGKAPRDLVSPELAEAAEKLLTSVIESGQPLLNIPLTGSIASEPNVERFYLVSYFPVKGGQGQGTLGVGIMATEVTERRRLEEQLLDAQKMEAVGRLAGGVAHDFNNLLTAIKSYSELLLADMDSSNPQRADVIEINGAADRAATLTRQLLAFSRQQMLRPEVMDLNGVITGMQGVLRSLIPADVRIETRLPSIGSVKADPSQIERVIVNLVLNARDAMPRGGTISIETADVELDENYGKDHAGTEPGPYVMLAVSDTGTGIPKEVRDKLFEPFFTTKPLGQGTGLGLSSVYGIVKQSGGHIWVYSEPGKGTSFKIYLPRDAAPMESATTRHARRNAGGATIILVEDDEVVRNVACRVLKRAGFAVLEAKNGKAAFDLYEATNHRADLIVTDVVMPEMNGPELAERIRRVNPDARILFMSGYTEDKVIRENLLAPGAAFLEKPFTPEALTRKAREILEAPPHRGAAA